MFAFEVDGGGGGGGGASWAPGHHNFTLLGPSVYTHQGFYDEGSGRDVVTCRDPLAIMGG